MVTILTQPAYYFMLLPIFIGVWKYKLLSHPFKILIWLSLFVVLTEVVANFLTEWRISNHLIYGLFTYGDTLFIYFIYLAFGAKEKTYRYAFTWLMLLFGFFIVNQLFIQPAATLPTFNIMAASLFQILLVMLYFRQVLDSTIIQKLATIPGFWFSCITLIYQSVTFFRWVVFEINVEAEYYNNFFYQMNMIALYVLYSIRALAIWIDSRNIHEAARTRGH